ncbi:hypothetical protein LNTAR_15237 [Lentisphaera araneosa HTCC2155]|uniref:Lipoprotein SmpA/OmlA domain-containing protein n=1 Tax=Lentisphaera araneosa HTCC2155 TaxID=313628 RepID=A6DRH2_9BACT|nr:hypothetical protein [Lentisphaera araneosa]EDM25782.1 hypothetical protein LNTAR_15237 [Lentisphaera araneosa HTCC2155]
MKMVKVILMSLMIIAMSSCTSIGLGTVSKTNELSPGMHSEKVKEVLGEPSQTHFVKNKWIWKYSLHQYFKGWVPYYLVFNKDTQKLESWYADENEYMQQQQLWMQSN